VRSDPKVKWNENLRNDFTAADVRFTTKARDLFAFIMGVPEPGQPAVVSALAPARGLSRGRIEHVELLGHDGRLSWRIDEQAGLLIEVPPEVPSRLTLVFRVKGALG
jgi:alpha-L-fucosidase